MQSPVRAQAAPISTSESRCDLVVASVQSAVIPTCPSYFYEPLKAILDVFLGVMMLVLAAPVILVVSVAVRLTTPGPAFYTQTRVGKGGRHFRIIKIRTMYYDCEKQSGVKWSTKGDPRVTRLGRFLRMTHLDELPQLLNVIRGEMSLVGPRPERPEIIVGLEKAIPNYHLRHQIRPGITGLAQLRLAADSCIQGVRHKLAYDVHYIRDMGFWLDLRLIICTLAKMFKLPLTEILWLFKIPGDRTIGFEPASGEVRFATVSARE